MGRLRSELVRDIPCERVRIRGIATALADLLETAMSCDGIQAALLTRAVGQMILDGLSVRKDRQEQNKIDKLLYITIVELSTQMDSAGADELAYLCSMVMSRVQEYIERRDPEIALRVSASLNSSFIRLGKC